MKVSPARSFQADRLARGETMVARQDDDQRFPDQELVDQIGVALLRPQEGRVELSGGEAIGKLRRMLAGDGDLDAGQFLAQHMHRAPAAKPARSRSGIPGPRSVPRGEPRAGRRRPPLRPGPARAARDRETSCPPRSARCRARCGSSAWRRPRLPARAAGGSSDGCAVRNRCLAATVMLLLLGHGDEIAEMPQLHGCSCPCLRSMMYKPIKSFLRAPETTP